VADLSGVWAATLTPVDAELTPDAVRAAAYYAELLTNGCDGVNVLGTTGEAMSFGIDQRIAFMQALATALPVDRMMAGTGAASLADAVRLARCAVELRLRASLVLPPFFFRDASLDGIVRFYVELVTAVPELAGKLVLYNFPKMSGFTFGPAAMRRLMAELPDAIVGLKDSSNDRQLQNALVTEFPQLRVFAGSEAYLPEALERGAAGCISATVGLWPELAQSAAAGDGVAAATVARARESFTDLPLIPAMRYAVARARTDEAWLRAMPPNETLADGDRQTLERRLAALETLDA
jgi:4-hydroxy-tetrahydrodipicolinate synthase